MKTPMLLTAILGATFLYALTTVSAGEQQDESKQANLIETAKAETSSTFYFACSARHGLVPGYCVEFATYDEALAEKERHKNAYPEHSDVTASGGKCPF